MQENHRQENLRLVYQTQRAEFLQHRLSISNAYTLVMTGLVVILGVLIVSADSPRRLSLAILIGLVIPTMVFFTCWFMWTQRREANTIFYIMRNIEQEFGFYEEDRYLPGHTVLPSCWQIPPRSGMGFTRGDWLQVAILVILMFAVEFAVFYLPGESPPSFSASPGHHHHANCDFSPKLA